MKKISEFYARHHLTIILIISIILSLTSFAYFYHEGLITAYGDSRAHLNIARRVVDSMTPGAAQLGGYWLPLLHILMLPTIWIDFFWHTGISGSIPNMISYIVSIFFIYKLIFEMTKSKLSATISAAIMLGNINLFYMQVTPMTEVLFVATLTIGIYFFYKWTAGKNIMHLIFSAFFLALSSFNRFEGWLVVVAATGVLIIDWLTKKLHRRGEAEIILFSLVAWSGILVWLLWGLVIFHDPLEFLHNKLSATNQTDVSMTTGYHNIPLAISVNTFAAIHVTGIVLVILAIIGIVVYLFRNYRHIFKKEYSFPFIFLAPFIFDVYTLFTGNVPTEVPEFSKLPYPANIFNIRYALYSLPAIALFISLISPRKVVKYILLFIVVLNYVLMPPFNGKRIMLLEDVSARAQEGSRSRLVWFKVNYKFDGKILISNGSSDGFMHGVGIPLSNYITEGTYKIWDESMQNPAKHATWIITSSRNKRDQVYLNINKHRMQSDFKVVYKDGAWMVLKRKE